MQVNGIEIPAQAIAELCRRSQVRRLSLFGSILGSRFGPGSDIDVLVEFEPGKGPGLFGFAGMQMELTRLLGRQVHLHTPAMLGPAFRDEVLREARVQYAA
jgi:predicted nucleotidyltransferase